MDYSRLERDVERALRKTLAKVDGLSYRREINAFCVYTDESCMCMSFMFNTETHLAPHAKDKYFLSYKMNPAEWFSESKTSVAALCNAEFGPIWRRLGKHVLAQKSGHERHVEQFGVACIAAIQRCQKAGLFGDDAFVLLTMSDFGKEQNARVLGWVKALNSPRIVREFKRAWF